MTAPSDPASPQESFGRYLAQQRELRGMSLEQIADATKLSLSMLRALETDDAKRLPERVFQVGAVRAYAKALGLSPEETLLRLHEAWGDAPAPAVLSARRAPPSTLRWVALGAVLLLAAGLALHFGR